MPRYSNTTVVLLAILLSCFLGLLFASALNELQNPHPGDSGRSATGYISQNPDYFHFLTIDVAATARSTSLPAGFAPVTHEYDVRNRVLWDGRSQLVKFTPSRTEIELGPEDRLIAIRWVLESEAGLIVRNEIVQRHYPEFFQHESLGLSRVFFHPKLAPAPDHPAGLRPQVDVVEPAFGPELDVGESGSYAIVRSFDTPVFYPSNSTIAWLPMTYDVNVTLTYRGFLPRANVGIDE